MYDEAVIHSKRYIGATKLMLEVPQGNSIYCRKQINVVPLMNRMRVEKDYSLL